MTHLPDLDLKPSMTWDFGPLNPRKSTTGLIAHPPNSEDLTIRVSKSNAGASQNHNLFQLDVPRMVMTASVTVSFTTLKNTSTEDPNSPISTVVFKTTGPFNLPTTPRMLPANQNFSKTLMSFQEKKSNASVMRIILTSMTMVFNTSKSTGEVSMLREMLRKPKLELKLKLRLPLRPLLKPPREKLLRMPRKLPLRREPLRRRPQQMPPPPKLKLPKKLLKPQDWLLLLLRMLRKEKSFSLKPKRLRKLLLRLPLRRNSLKKPKLTRKKWRDLEPNNKPEKLREKSKRLLPPRRKLKPRLRLKQRPRKPDKRKRKLDSLLKLKRDQLSPKECKLLWNKPLLMLSRHKKKLWLRKRNKKPGEEKERTERESKERQENLLKSKERRLRLLKSREELTRKLQERRPRPKLLRRLSKKQQDDEHAEQLRLDQEAHEKALAEQKAKDDLLKAQRAEELAQSQEDIRAAQEAAAKAQKAFEDAEEERKKVAAHKKQLAEDLAQKEAEAKNAEAAAKVAAQAQKQA